MVFISCFSFSEKFEAENEKGGCPRSFEGDVVLVQEHFGVLLKSKQGRGHA